MLLWNALLGILCGDERCTDSMVNAAYRKKSLIAHQDRRGGSRRKFHQMTTAYEYFKDQQMWRL
jgi:curved DNA-binding protein CbpA